MNEVVAPDEPKSSYLENTYHPNICRRLSKKPKHYSLYYDIDHPNVLKHAKESPTIVQKIQASDIFTDDAESDCDLEQDNHEIRTAEESQNLLKRLCSDPHEEAPKKQKLDVGLAKPEGEGDTMTNRTRATPVLDKPIEGFTSPTNSCLKCGECVQCKRADCGSCVCCLKVRREQVEELHEQGPTNVVNQHFIREAVLILKRMDHFEKNHIDLKLCDPNMPKLEKFTSDSTMSSESSVELKRDYLSSATLSPPMLKAESPQASQRYLEVAKATTLTGHKTPQEPDDSDVLDDATLDDQTSGYSSTDTAVVKNITEQTDSRQHCTTNDKVVNEFNTPNGIVTPGAAYAQSYTAYCTDTTVIVQHKPTVVSALINHQSPNTSMYSNQTQIQDKLVSIDKPSIISSAFKPTHTIGCVRAQCEHRHTPQCECVKQATALRSNNTLVQLHSVPSNKSLHEVMVRDSRICTGNKVPGVETYEMSSHECRHNGTSQESLRSDDTVHSLLSSFSSENYDFTHLDVEKLKVLAGQESSFSQLENWFSSL